MMFNEKLAKTISMILSSPDYQAHVTKKRKLRYASNLYYTNAALKALKSPMVAREENAKRCKEYYARHREKVRRRQDAAAK